DLLSYARVIELNCQNMVLLPLLTAVAKNIAEQHKITLDIDCPEQLTVYADVYKLQQVLVNLLDNGAVFGAMVENGNLLVQAKQTDNAVQISFHNNGPAITPLLQSELFKPFISKRVGGSGLGLAIVQRIMKAHHGSIIFSEQLGWNVSFVCSFPKIQK
ncbi:MAG: HAMP domain-containing histidine kinase, partial [Psychrosphaera sp.]|nr:HAMP domain-containing histidine kinase [Psychrosphaera sp.]